MSMFTAIFTCLLCASIALPLGQGTFLKRDIDVDLDLVDEDQPGHVAIPNMPRLGRYEDSLVDADLEADFKAKKKAREEAERRRKAAAERKAAEEAERLAKEE